MKMLKEILKYTNILAGVALMAVYFFMPSTDFEKIGSYVMTIALVFVPRILEKVGMDIDDRFEAEYYAFLLLAMVLGIDLNWYKGDWQFDKIVHCISGGMVAVFADEMLRFGKFKGEKWLRALVMVGLVALTAVLWECFEFSYDQIFNGNMQELVSSGVADTMYDMIVALIGGTVVTKLIFWKKSY